MPAYTYTTNKLVSDAYKLISAIDQNDTLQAVQLQDGVEKINEILSCDEQAGTCVPYFEVITFQMVPGTRTYEFALESSGINPDPLSGTPFLTVSNPISLVESVQLFLLQNTRIPIDERNRDQFFNTMRYNLATGQPMEYLFQRAINTSFLMLWPTPSQNYYCEISCKKMFTYVTINSNLPTIPSYYYRYLKYALAKELGACYNDAIWTDRHETTFAELKLLIKSTNDTDYSLQVSPALMGTRVYPIANNLILP